MSVTIYAGGFFRSREGYKCICFDEKKGDPYPFATARVANPSVVIWVTEGGSALKDADSLSDMVEEIAHYEPNYVDPLKPVVKPTKDLWERVDQLIAGFELHKFSPKTGVQDVKASDMPQAMRIKLDRTNVHKVWRCRSGRGCKWYYGWSKEEAIEKLLSGGASPRRATGRT